MAETTTKTATSTAASSST